MTSKEAIRVLEDNRPSVIFVDEDAQKRMTELCKAIDMAIEALSEPPTIPMFAESEEAYKEWTGEEMGGGRLIDADRLKSYIDCGHLRPPTEVCFSELDVCNMIDKAPTVLADRPQGEWKHTTTWQPYCSNCEYVFGEDEEFSPFWKYCPMCGARMKGGGTDNGK